MCDYSLEHVESRAAKVGDQLVSTVFSNSITRGFAEVGNPQLAICLAPGTELVFDRDVECDHALGFFPTKKMGGKHGTFQTNQPRSPPRASRCARVPIGAYRPSHEACGGPTRYRVATSRGSAADGSEIG